MPHLDTLAYIHILRTFWTLILGIFLWNNKTLFLFIKLNSLYTHINKKN